MERSLPRDPLSGHRDNGRLGYRGTFAEWDEDGFVAMMEAGRRYVSARDGA